MKLAYWVDRIINILGMMVFFALGSFIFAWSLLIVFAMVFAS